MKNFSQSESKLIDWAERTYQPQDSLLAKVKANCEKQGLPNIQVGPFDGLHLEVLTRAIGAKKVLEIGTLGGYSAICLLRGMGSEGRLTTIEFDHKHAALAGEHIRWAGYESQTKILVGPALEWLPKLESDAPFDLIFIDADKVNYPNYLNYAAKYLRKGGLLIADNTFGFGLIADDKFETPDQELAVKGLRLFTKNLLESGNFRATILPTGEGMTLAVKN